MSDIYFYRESDPYDELTNFVPIWFGLIILIAERPAHGYTHISQAIRELGASGAPCASIVNFAGFLPRR